MLLVPVGFLRPGMAVAQPVLHPEKDALLLLGAGFTLDSATITKLQTHRVTHVWVSFPGLEDLPGPSESVSNGHLALIDTLNKSIDRLERKVSVQVNVQHYRKAVHQMLAEIIADPSHDPLTHQLATCGPSLAGHLSNTAYLALLVGAHLAGYLRDQRKALASDIAENTAQLGLGALLHDIGKLAMPDELQNWNILDPQSQTPEYRTHPSAGYREVRDHVSPVAAYVVLNHHQRFDGQGFPPKAIEGGIGEPLRGEKIHVFARIVSCVDVFDHLMTPGGKAVPTIMAIHAIKSPRFAGWFDPVVVNALLRIVPAFMLGSVVKLSDGTEAVVIANHPEAPCRPTVRLLSCPIGEPNCRATRRQLDLRMCRNLSISEVDGHDVRPYLFQGEFEPGQVAA
jgi:HD-GYP domain-containing protein (c-di-GMP phosphodiesterase class II)